MQKAKPSVVHTLPKTAKNVFTSLQPLRKVDGDINRPDPAKHPGKATKMVQGIYFP